MTTLVLSNEVPQAQRAALAELPGVVVTAAPRSALITQDSVTQLEIRRLAANDVAHAAEHPDPAALLVIAGVLSDRHVFALEDADQPFVDAAGRAWVPGAPRTGKAAGQTGGPVRPQTLRAAQLLADHPGVAWTTTGLAKRADIGQATADRLMRRLLELKLLRREGAGRSTTTFVDDPSALRHWLLRFGGRASHRLLPFYVRDPDGIPAEIDGHRLIRSGAHGATLLGLPVVSGTPRMMLRVEASDEELESLPSRLRGVRSERGANAVLVADPGRLAAVDARMVHDVWIAPPSRLCLDIASEARGDAAAAVFLDLWDDRVL